MADTFTINLNLRLPQLGKKPWKADWDFNFTRIDQILGGLTIDGSVPAKVAETVLGGALTPFIDSVSGTLSGAASIPDGDTHEIRVDHSADLVFDLPIEPIVTAPGGVNCVLLAERNTLNATEAGGVFVLRVENHSGSTVAGADIAWLRKGLKL